MNILIYGAGVLGSLYAARLQEAGQNVSLLARGKRLQDILEHGIVLEDVATGRETSTSVHVVDRLGPEDAYDFVIVIVGKHQLAPILPELAANVRTPNVLFMHNNAAGPDEMVEALGRQRVLSGFPGAGGYLQGYVDHYMLIKQQPTTLGELDGQTTPRLQDIAGALKDAGFAVEISSNMDAWLKTHAVFVSCIEAAIIKAGGSNYELARRRNLLLLMVKAIREGFRALQAQGIPIVPFKVRLMFMYMPAWFPVFYWRQALKSKVGEVSLAAHANVASAEVRLLIEEVRKLVRNTSVPTPAMDRLYEYIE